MKVTLCAAVTLIVGFLLTPGAAMSQSAPQGGPTPSPPGAKVEFVDLKDGAVIGPKTTIHFGLSGMGVAPAGTVRANSGHHHLLIDTDLPQLDQPIPSDENSSPFRQRPDADGTDVAARPAHAAIAPRRRQPHPAQPAGRLREEFMSRWSTPPLRNRPRRWSFAILRRPARAFISCLRRAAPMCRRRFSCGSGLEKMGSRPPGSTSRTRATTIFSSTRNCRRWINRFPVMRTTCISAAGRPRRWSPCRRDGTRFGFCWGTRPSFPRQPPVVSEPIVVYVGMSPPSIATTGRIIAIPPSGGRRPSRDGPPAARFCLRQASGRRVPRLTTQCSGPRSGHADPSGQRQAASSFRAEAAAQSGRNIPSRLAMVIVTGYPRFSISWR